MKQIIFILTLIFATVLLGFAQQESPVQKYFQKRGFIFPVHLSIDKPLKPKLVTPGVGEVETDSAEHQKLYDDGRSFLKEKASLQFFRQIAAKADAFVISDPFLYRESYENANMQLAVWVYAYGLNRDRSAEITIPHNIYTVDDEEIYVLKNILLLKKSDGEWKPNGFVY